jgi:hypothetical protein
VVDAEGEGAFFEIFRQTKFAFGKFKKTTIKVAWILRIDRRANLADASGDPRDRCIGPLDRGFQPP